MAPAACEGELSVAPSWARGSSSRDELMFGGVQLVLGRVEKGIVNLLTLFGRLAVEDPCVEVGW